VFQAQTQLANAQSDDLGLVRQRAQLEHAIAVLVGKTPSEFAIARCRELRYNVTVPEVPVGVPSTLLQRRPDIAGAERAWPRPTSRSASRARPTSRASA
jgi:outer membrane protein TolC